MARHDDRSGAGRPIRPEAASSGPVGTSEPVEARAPEPPVEVFPHPRAGVPLVVPDRRT